MARRFGVGLTVAAVLAGAAAGSDLQRFRDQLADAEAAYSAAESVVRVSQLDGDGSSFQVNDYTQTTDGRSQSWSVAAPATEGRRRPIPGSGPWPAGGYNPEYAFSLGRRNGAWWVAELSPPGDGRAGAYDALHLPFAIRKTTYRDALGRPAADPRFRPATVWQGKPHPEWRFTGDLLDQPSRPFGLILDPDRPGLVRALREYDPDGPDEVLGEYRMDYQPTADRWPPPAKYEGLRADPAETPRQLRAFNRQEVVSHRRLDPPPPASAFTVSAFGLPEPVAVPPSPERFFPPLEPDGGPTPLPDEAAEGRWVWWVVGGILTVGAVAFVLVGRRPAAGGGA